MQFLGSDHGKALGEVKAHLMAEKRYGSSSGPIAFWLTLVEDTAHQVEILFHDIEEWWP